MIPGPLLLGTTRQFQIEHLLPTESRSNDLAQLPDERKLMCFTLPSWQRPEVWSMDKKVRFIEGIFLGLGCGYLVVNRYEWLDGGRPAPMSGWLIDGQQRVAAIRDFINDEVAIFDGSRFSDIDQRTIRRRFWYASFPHFELDYTDNEAILQDLYDRLNFGGVAHTPEDRLALNLLDTPSL